MPPGRRLVSVAALLRSIRNRTPRREQPDDFVDAVLDGHPLTGRVGAAHGHATAGGVRDLEGVHFG